MFLENDHVCSPKTISLPLHGIHVFFFKVTRFQIVNNYVHINKSSLHLCKQKSHNILLFIIIIVIHTLPSIMSANTIIMVDIYYQNTKYNRRLYLTLWHNYFEMLPYVRLSAHTRQSAGEERDLASYVWNTRQTLNPFNCAYCLHVTYTLPLTSICGLDSCDGRRTEGSRLQILAVPSVPVISAHALEVIRPVRARAVVDTHIRCTLILVDFAEPTGVPPLPTYTREHVLAKTIDTSGFVQTLFSMFNAGVRIVIAVVTLPAILADTCGVRLIQSPTLLVVVACRILTRICK
jgi:hypothetical protein